MISIEQLHKIIPHAGARAELFIEYACGCNSSGIRESIGDTSERLAK